MYASERRARERIVDFEVRRLERSQALERTVAVSNHRPGDPRRVPTVPFHPPC
jgi:hypothetical protein